MNFLADGERSTEEIGETVGKTMLDFHLKLLQQASLIEMEKGTVKLSEYGRNFLKDKEEKSVDKTADISQAKPVEIVEVKQLLPCIADSSRFRVIADMVPPLSGTLKILEPLIVQKGEIITTIYSTGKVTMTMIKNKVEAREALDNLKSTINEAIAKGVTPAPREKIRVEPMQFYKYLPKTDCGKCGEQSCYTFAIKLMSGVTSLDKCIPLKEPEYATNQEHLQVLSMYI
jgi:ArsR family metal-binding transcriptional regulator